MAIKEIDQQGVVIFQVPLEERPLTSEITVFHSFVYIIPFAGMLSASTGSIRLYNKTGHAQTISQVFIAVNSAPAGAAIIVDVNKNGTTIFTNQTHRPQIAAGANTGTASAIDVPTFVDGDYLTADIDQVGATPGSNLTVHIVMTGQEGTIVTV